MIAVFRVAVSRGAVAALCAGALAAGMFLLTGCGPTADAKKGATVKGKVLNDGQALESTEYKPGEKTVRLSIGLFDDKGKGAGSEVVKSDGSFVIEGVAPGKYRVTFDHFDMGLVPESTGSTTVKPGQSAVKQGGGGGPRATNDRLKGKFSIDNSQIFITVPEGKAEHDVGTIDLAKQDTWNK